MKIVFKTTALAFAITSQLVASSISGNITFLDVIGSQPFAEGEGMATVQLDNNLSKTIYILPSSKNYNQMVAVLLSAYSTGIAVTISHGYKLGQPTISSDQIGSVSLGARN